MALHFIDATSDSWRAAGGEDGPQPHPPVRAHSLLTLEQWHAVRETWPASAPVGVTLANTVDIEDLVDDLHRLALVELQFPKWVDGRAYTQARLLRSRYRFAGEIRATGDVLVDMVPLMLRTGFSSARLRPDQKREFAERALRQFAGHYQGDAVEPRPHWRRDLAAEQQAQQAAQQDRALLSAGEGI